MPHAATRISTSPAPGAGVGRSFNSRCPYSVRTRACISEFFHSGPTFHQTSIPPQYTEREAVLRLKNAVHSEEHLQPYTDWPIATIQNTCYRTFYISHSA